MEVHEAGYIAPLSSMSQSDAAAATLCVFTFDSKTSHYDGWIGGWVSG